MPQSERQKKWRADHPEKVREYSRRYLKKNKDRLAELRKENPKTPDFTRASMLKYRYGLTVDQYEKMVEDQDGRCKICTRESKLFVDHCHETGKIRGLLCNPCNAGMGYLQDDPVVLNAALQYLLAGK